ncbi:MAG: hypothetical protein EOP54_01965 [Sphingobacteriales bacterium]|nr:MAG: hypothetical protein EOP54_01965 [Sphingobacteriales bacterium]
MKKKCFVVFLSFILIPILHLQAQSPDQGAWANKYQNLETGYTGGTLSEEQYMKAVDSLSEQLTVSGIRLSNTAFTGFLARYRDIAWRDDTYRSFRPNYFRYLMNHTLAAGRFGEALFYAEKNATEASLNGKQTFLIPYMKLLIWAKSKNYEKVIELYTEERGHILSLLQKQLQDSNSTEYLQSLQFLVYVMKPLLESKHPWAEEVKDNAIKMEALIQDRFPELNVVKVDLSIPRLLALFCNIDYYAYLDDREREKALLDSAHTILNDNRERIGSYRAPYENILNAHSYDYYIKIKDNKQAALYLDKLIAGVKIFDDERSNLFTFRAKLSYNQGDLKAAYTFLDSALYYKTQESATAQQEITHLMYAFTESEYNKAELKRADKKRRVQNIWILSISLVTVLVILIFYISMRKIKRKSREQIAVLNRIADITIEEAKRYGAKEEQGKLARDLHDDLSASLISAMHITEFASQKTDPAEVLTYIQELHKRISTIYHSVRDKSHQISRQATDEENDHFEESVKRIMDAALIATFNRQLNIEKEASRLLTIEQRVELIKILQEAVANILKHSKATEVKVYLWQEEKQLIFQVSDNGIGFTTNTMPFGFGIGSLKKRAKSLQGELQLLSQNGLILIISFPAAVNQ